MKKHPMLKYLKEQGLQGGRLPLIMCPGCGSGQVLNFLFMAVDALIHEQGYRKDDFVFISGVGCHARLTSHYLNFDSGWTLHGRTLAVATGALLANPDLQLIVITGDGDTGAIGGNHFIHACRRNLNLTIVCLNNKLYGMTGGQSSPTTLDGETTSTNPYGSFEADFDLCELAKTAGASYVARWTTAHPTRAIKAIRKGIERQGTAFIEILSQCPTHFKQTPVQMLRDFKEQTVPVDTLQTEAGAGKIGVGEFQDIQRPDWISSYQRVVQEARSSVDPGTCAQESSL
ncbi:MAG: 2-oxoacid:ferredoxin oxidoreductase subunit beta [Desulfohalobiaceae bacterium]|nr:2-oxoacid:ferredoxin oxidoreductase subunit beta [Desulfohalobiaceae bacterium]